MWTQCCECGDNETWSDLFCPFQMFYFRDGGEGKMIHGKMMLLKEEPETLPIFPTC